LLHCDEASAYEAGVGTPRQRQMHNPVLIICRTVTVAVTVWSPLFLGTSPVT